MTFRFYLSGILPTALKALKQLLTTARRKTHIFKSARNLHSDSLTWKCQGPVCKRKSSSKGPFPLPRSSASQNNLLVQRNTFKGGHEETHAVWAVLANCLMTSGFATPSSSPTFKADIFTRPVRAIAHPCLAQQFGGQRPIRFASPPENTCKNTFWRMYRTILETGG